MRQRISAEFSRRSFYLCLGPIEAFGERRSREWPVQWAISREADSLELWMGRAYLCFARGERASPEIPETATKTETTECQILAFKTPVPIA
jgi:hypothetical protein